MSFEFKKKEMLKYQEQKIVPKIAGFCSKKKAASALLHPIVMLFSRFFLLLVLLKDES